MHPTPGRQRYAAAGCGSGTASPNGLFRPADNSPSRRHWGPMAPYTQLPTLPYLSQIIRLSLRKGKPRPDG